MDNLIGKIVDAIATGEGFFAPGNPPPKRNNNPGDLRAAPWRIVGSYRIVNGFAVFGSLAEGIAGAYHQVALDTARGLSLRQLIGKWAPGSDGNDTENYIRETARRIGMPSEDIDQPLWNFLEIHHLP